MPRQAGSCFPSQTLSVRSRLPPRHRRLLAGWSLSPMPKPTLRRRPNKDRKAPIERSPATIAQRPDWCASSSVCNEFANGPNPTRRNTGEAAGITSEFRADFLCAVYAVALSCKPLVRSFRANLDRKLKRRPSAWQGLRYARRVRRARRGLGVVISDISTLGLGFGYLVWALERRRGEASQ